MSEVVYVGLHIHKAAGTTLQVHLESHLPWTLRHTAADVNQKTARLHLNELGILAANHTQVVWGHHVHEALLTNFNRPVSLFVFLRDPVARIVSWFDYERAQYGVRETFEEFVDGHANSMCEMVVSAFPSLIEPQAESLAARAISILEKFNFIGCQENFLEHAAILMNEIGIPPIPSDLRLNVKQGSHRAELSSEQRAFLLEKNAEDVELYDRFFLNGRSPYRSEKMHNFSTVNAENFKEELRSVAQMAFDLRLPFNHSDVFDDVMHSSLRRLMLSYFCSPEEQAGKIMEALKLLSGLNNFVLDEYFLHFLRQRVMRGEKLDKASIDALGNV